MSTPKATNILQACPECDGPLHPGPPPKGMAFKCPSCKSVLLWAPLPQRWYSLPSDEAPVERRVIRYHARDLTRLPRLQMTSGGRLVQRCLSCWREIEVLQSSPIAIGYQGFFKEKNPWEPAPPPPEWSPKWFPFTKTQKGPGCQACARDYTAYCGRRGDREVVSKVDGSTKVYSAPYIPVDREHFDFVKAWLEGAADMPPAGFRLLIALKASVPAQLALKLLRSCEKRFGEPSKVEGLEPFGSALLWDGPLQLHSILPLKKAVDRFPPALREGMLIIVEEDDAKMLSYLTTLREGGAVNPCWGTDVLAEADIDWGHE